MNPSEWLSANLTQVIVALAEAGAAIEPESLPKESHGVDTATT